MKNGELRFTSAQDYLNYDFDDNYGFFAAEMTAYMDSIERVDPGESMNIDFPHLVVLKIHELFKTYDTLIINPDEERLYGEIHGERFYLKDGYHEDPNHPY